jgi:uncharacterized membrane protein
MRNEVRFAIYGAVASLITGTAGAAVGYGVEARRPMPQEKCYGIAAAQQNDCQTLANSCAGTSQQDRQWDSFLLVPKGLCARIGGGNLALLKQSAANG